MDRASIDAFEDGGRILRESVAGLTRDELTARPGPGKWSILEVVVHLLDSDQLAIDRMKRMLTEENPSLLYADETAYIDRLHPHSQDLEECLVLFELGRRQFARILRLLPDEAFDRVGTHNKKGLVTVGKMVKGYVDHLQAHLPFIHGKREKLGKPIPQA